MPKADFGGITPPHISYFTLRPYIPDEVMSRKEAQEYFRRSPRTTDSWIQTFGLGSRIGGRMAVSRVASQMFMEKDYQALTLYLRGDRSDPRVTSHYRRLGIELPANIAAGE